ncbi:TetR/AcrR family transcriptional regulator [Oligoflexus tunisiensis]|uniref:TetR/AcrR family transcriptional regulator n=1 Tax=Oligoflexus tunisiensis TaxID=708132 RepID=UPI00159F11D0|nr:WHG domain-containing protein [Oligoflexus tunisiensis]
MTKKYHHGDLREALIAETLEMLRNDEGALIGFRELARRLEVSRTAPYRHFESVEHLLAVVAEEGYRKFVDALELVTANRSLSSKEHVLELGVAYINFALDNSSHYRLMFDPKFFQDERFREIKQLSSKSFGFLKQAVATCLPPNSTEEDTTHMANLAWAMVHGMSRLFIDGQWNKIHDRQDFIRRSCRQLLAIL